MASCSRLLHTPTHPHQHPRPPTHLGIQHLDLSTDYTSFKAYAYSAPTLADVDGDGKLEVILGTSMGFLYVLDCYGVTRPGFPLQMGDIQVRGAYKIQSFL